MSADGKQMRKQTKEKHNTEAVQKIRGWISWTKARQEESSEVLLAMIQNGRLPSQVNPDLPANHKVPYPFYLQAQALVGRSSYVMLNFEAGLDVPEKWIGEVG